MSFFTSHQIDEFNQMIDSLKEEIFSLDEKLSTQNITHKKKWLYSKGFDYDFNFYDDFTKNLKTNLNLGGEDIFYCDQLWAEFKEKYEFSVKEISPFFNVDYVKFYFADNYEAKVKKVNEILTKYRFVRLKIELPTSRQIGVATNRKI